MEKYPNRSFGKRTSLLHRTEGNGGGLGGGLGFFIAQRYMYFRMTTILVFY